MRKTKLIFNIILFLAGIFSSVNMLYAHCDTMSGPVVQAAQKAMQTGNVNYVLVWVKKEDEDKIKKAFKKTQKVRALGPDAQDLADNYFYETLVRIHRAGEGEPYTGLKTAAEIDPGIELADKAIEKGSLADLKNGLGSKFNAEIAEKYNEVIKKKNYKTDDVKAGREYVAAYVEFIHYVEALYAGHEPEHHSHKK